MSANLRISSSTGDLNGQLNGSNNATSHGCATTTATLKTGNDSELIADDATTNKVSSGHDNRPNEVDKVFKMPLFGYNRTTAVKKKPLASTSTVEKNRVDTSRRGGRGGFRRGGASRAGGGEKADQLNSQGCSHPARSDAPLFMTRQDNQASSGSPTSQPNEGVKHNRNPHLSTNYICQDLLKQLETNINSGLSLINNAFEMVRQGQLEFQHAKNTLANIYKSQNGDLGQGQGFLVSQNVASPTGDHHPESFLESTSFNDENSTSEVYCDTTGPSPLGQPLSPSAEGFQVQLDSLPIVDDDTSTEVVSVVSEFTMDQGEVKQEGEPKTVEERGGQRVDEKIGRSFIVLHDVQPILDTLDELPPNAYSAVQVEACLRKLERLPTMKRRQSTEPSPQKPETGTNLAKEVQPDNTRKGQDQPIVPPSKPLISGPIDEDDDEAQERKMSRMTTGNGCNNSRSSKKRKNQLPHWRQLRVEPEIMERIRRRLLNSYMNRDSESICSNVSSSQPSHSVADSPAPSTSPADGCADVQGSMSPPGKEMPELAPDENKTCSSGCSEESKN